MKCFIFLLFFVISLCSFGQSSVDLTVRVVNLENNKGLVQLGLYNTVSRFPEVGETFKMVRLKTKGNQTVYTFKDLPKGSYALAIYHDENANKICDTNFFGIPKEAYAFSNNFRPRFSVPSFECCDFSLFQDKLIEIKMIY